MVMTDWTIIKRSMQTRRLSTGVTIASVAVSVALMLVLLSMRHAGEQAFSRGSGNVHLIVSRDNAPLLTVLNQLFYKEIPPRAIGWAEYQRLAASAPFEWAIPTQLGDSYMGQPVLATTPEFFTGFQPVEGRPWRLAPRRAGDKAEPRMLRDTFDVVLGSLAARATGLRIGDGIHLTHGTPSSRGRNADGGDPAAPHVHEAFTFTVVGVLEPTGSAHDRAIFSHLDAAWLLHALDRHEAEESEEGEAGDAGHHHDEPALTVSDLSEQDRRITGVLLRVATRPGMRASAAIQTVFDQLRRDPTITVAQPVQQVFFLFRIVSSIDQVLLAMALVVMISAAVSILLSLYNSMDQRRRQIAVLRVLGASGGRIFGLVMTESAIIGLAGAALGVGLSYLAGLGVSRVMFERLGLLIEPSYGAEWLLAVVVAAVLLSCAAGLAPALRAYRTSVAEHLKPAA